MLHQNIVERITAIQLSQDLFHRNNKNRFTVNRNCSCCKRKITTKDVKFIGENKSGVWFNCNFCDSTMIQITKVRFKGPQAV